MSGFMTLRGTNLQVSDLDDSDLTPLVNINVLQPIHQAARELCDGIIKNNFKFPMLCSSSIDFPEEQGIPKAHLNELIIKTTTLLNIELEK